MKVIYSSPEYLNWILVLQLGLHFVDPMKRIILSPYNCLGVALIVAGVILNVYSSWFMEGNGATPEFHKVSSRLLVNGPFRFSRKPIYLSGVTVSLGIAVSLGSLSGFLFPVILFLVLDRHYIPDEEMRLANRFGRAYRYYKLSVPRWI